MRTIILKQLYTKSKLWITLASILLNGTTNQDCKHRNILLRVPECV